MGVEVAEDVVSTWPTTPAQVRICCLRLVAMCAEEGKGIPISEAVRAAVTFERYISDGTVMSQAEVMKIVVGK